MALAQVNPIPKPVPKPIPTASPLPIPIPIPKPTVVCARKCTDGMAQITFSDLNFDNTPNTCPSEAQQVYSCAPFGCDEKGKTCRTDCNTDQDCSRGFICTPNTKKCINVSYFCSGRLAMKGTDGSSRSCEPYACDVGSCLSNCQSTTDCYDGYRCNSEFRCVPIK